MNSTQFRCGPGLSTVWTLITLELGCAGNPARSFVYICGDIFCAPSPSFPNPSRGCMEENGVVGVVGQARL